MSNTDPKFLNLDELETTESDVKLKHKGKVYFMATLTVEQFIAQQKRAQEHQKLAIAAEENGDTEMVKLIQLMQDSIETFFPGLPVSEMETPKLFTIFAWLNELSQKISEVASQDGDASAEGKEVSKPS